MKAEVESQIAPAGAHIEQIMKSGFSMSDIKGLHRNYGEDPGESDEVMRNIKPTRNMPPRPPRKGSLTRNINAFDDNSK